MPLHEVPLLNITVLIKAVIKVIYNKLINEPHWLTLLPIKQHQQQTGTKTRPPPPPPHNNNEKEERKKKKKKKPNKDSSNLSQQRPSMCGYNLFLALQIAVLNPPPPQFNLKKFKNFSWDSKVHEIINNNKRSCTNLLTAQCTDADFWRRI